MASEERLAGMEAERDAVVAYLKAEAQWLYDNGGTRDAFDALCRVGTAIKYGHHWLK